MNILVAGSGGREHALAWRLAQTPGMKIYALPGNPGMANVAECLPADDLSPKTILAAARYVSADLTVIGPEAPLVAGVVDLFRGAEYSILGPDSKAAQLEGSKVFSKQFFQQHGIPTADFLVAHSYEEAARGLDRFTFPLVIKADGLAAGKGVTIAQSKSEAEQAIQLLGPDLVIEEFLQGKEVSFIVLSDGRDALPLLPCRDYKRLLADDKGPNTGGMGAFCDQALLTPQESDEILRTIILPTIQATEFTGFLYAGLMMTATGPKILEYNVRLGDPETQPLMYHLETDLAGLLMAAAAGNLGTRQFRWQAGVSACVIVAAEGYPATPKRGVDIAGIDAAQATGAIVFHSGTRIGWSGPVTDGGRVLGITARGATRAEAVARAYAGVEKIRFEGMQSRRDIGR